MAASKDQEKVAEQLEAFLSPNHEEFASWCPTPLLPPPVARSLMNPVSSGCLRRDLVVPRGRGGPSPVAWREAAPPSQTAAKQGNSERSAMPCG